jgi:hypothetical protein
MNRRRALDSCLRIYVERVDGWSERIRTHAFLIEPGLCAPFATFGNIAELNQKLERKLDIQSKSASCRQFLEIERFTD